MTIFNPEGKDILTFGECLDPAMRIVDQDDADQYFEAYAKFLEEKGKYSWARAVSIARSNLGYYAGYYDDETAARVRNLFGAVHPIFGDTTPTAEEAFKHGKELGNSMLHKTKITIK